MIFQNGVHLKKEATEKFQKVFKFGIYSIFGRFQVVLGKSDFSGIPDSFLIYVVRPP